VGIILILVLVLILPAFWYSPPSNLPKNLTVLGEEPLDISVLVYFVIYFYLSSRSLSLFIRLLPAYCFSSPSGLPKKSNDFREEILISTYNSIYASLKDDKYVRGG
jgi:hypothetical protein